MAIIVGLSIVVLIGFAGLAIDGGRLYLTKTELQNGADACALAASYHLTGAPNIAAGSFAEADASGRMVAQRNRVNFQGTPISSSEVTIEFGPALGGSEWVTSADSPENSAKYVRCTIQRTGITPFLMQVLGFGDATVNAMATATLANAQTSCAVPMALCTKTGETAPNYGYEKGDWIAMDFVDQTGGSGSPKDEPTPTNFTGNFRWIDFDPSTTTPGCAGKGASELSCLMEGTGQCNLPQPRVGPCTKSGSASPEPGCVGQDGAINSMEAAYNSRFGVYKNKKDIEKAPPDYTGYSYDSNNWTLGRSAFDGASGTALNFKDARAGHESTQSSFFTNPPYDYTVKDDHAAFGADRRVVVVPIVECKPYFETTQHAPIRAYACVLMLNPYAKDSGNKVLSNLEFLGRADEPGSPCATSGIAGNDTSQGPKVPALVQ